MPQIFDKIEMLFEVIYIQIQNQRTAHTNDVYIKSSLNILNQILSNLIPWVIF
jgi:hypothetical protein